MEKNILKVYQIVTAGSMTGNITSSVVNIQFLDNVSIQLIWTGTAVGTFAVQGSLNYSSINGTVLNAGTWSTITISPAPIANGASSDWLLDLNQLSFPWIRVVYTATSSTGTLNAYISGKAV